MTLINLEQLDLQNIWLSDAGELQVRPAMVSVLSPADGYRFQSGFSVKSPNTGEYFHYLFEQATSTMETTLKVYSDQFNQLFTYSVGPTPRYLKVDYSPVNTTNVADLEFLITSPSFDSIYGIIGGGVRRAVKGTPVNTNLTGLDIPRGISTQFGGRVVIGSGDNLYFSDPGAPETYTTLGIFNMPGTVYSLDVFPSGALLIGTDQGAYYLPPDAVENGQIILGIYQQLEDHKITDFKSVALSNGIPLALSRRGVKVLDEGQPELNLNPVNSYRRLSKDTSVPDYRVGSVFPWESGVVVSTKDDIFLIDQDRGFNAVWTEQSGLVDVMNAERDYFVFESGVKCIHGNNEDGVSGFLTGRLRDNPANTNRVRHISVGSSRGRVRTAIRGDTSVYKTPPAESPVLGTATWDASATWGHEEISSRRFDFSNMTDDMCLDIEIEECKSLITSPDLEIIPYKRKEK